MLLKGNFWVKWWREQSGATAAIAAVGMVAFAAFAALAVDVGRVVSVKSELQKAADAGALAGARAFFPYDTSSTRPKPLDWNTASSVALATVRANAADGSLLSSADVQVGFWDTTWAWPGPENLLDSASHSPSATLWPSVKVSISKKSGVNDGAVAMLFGPLLGKSTQEVTVYSVAGLAADGSMPSGGGFPLAVPEDLISALRGHDPPTHFRIGSAYHSPAPDHGQWTSLTTDNNSASFLKSIITDGNSETVNIGDNIWIQPGTENTCFNEIIDTMGPEYGQTVLLPVVGSEVDLTNKQFTPVLDFVPFVLTGAEKGSYPFVEGYFPNGIYVAPGGKAGGGGNGYILSGTPKLFN